MARLSLSLMGISSSILLVASNAQARQDGTSMPPVLESMAGRWDVTQAMFPGPRAKPVPLPPAIAVRTVAAGGGFVDEVMILAPGAPGDAFTRAAHINYNLVAKRFEYSSIDSRAPQLMYYQSPLRGAGDMGDLHFDGHTFTAAQWGGRRNVRFHYRIDLSAVDRDRQSMRLYLKPLAGGAEFVGFEYHYVRRR